MDHTTLTMGMVGASNVVSGSSQMNKLKIKTFTDLRGSLATEKLSGSPTVGELIDSIRDILTDQYHSTGQLPAIGYIEFLGEDGKLYVVWLDPIVMEVDEQVAHNPFIETE